MKLHIVTICLDGMPTLPALFFTLNQLRIDWTWHVCEGPSLNVKDTAWCKQQEPRYSEDGTHEFLEMISSHPRVHVAGKKMWTGGKVEMVNYPLSFIKEECVLMQIDADEIWTSAQLEKIVSLFSEFHTLDQMSFFCRYFLGVNILSTTADSYGNNAHEWVRSWRFRPGDKFLSHEPPAMSRKPRVYMNREDSRALGLVFDHYSWAFPNQVAYKEKFYGYHCALEKWIILQQNKKWPVNLKTFLPWVDARATAEKLHP